MKMIQGQVFSVSIAGNLATVEYHPSCLDWVYAGEVNVSGSHDVEVINVFYGETSSFSFRIDKPVGAEAYGMLFKKRSIIGFELNETDSTMVAAGCFSVDGCYPAYYGYSEKEVVFMDVLKDYVKRSELPDLSPYAKTSQLPDLSPYAKTSQLPDLSPYAKKEGYFAATLEITVKQGQRVTETWSLADLNKVPSDSDGPLPTSIGGAINQRLRVVHAHISPPPSSISTIRRFFTTGEIVFSTSSAGEPSIGLCLTLMELVNDQPTIHSVPAQQVFSANVYFALAR